MNDDDKRAILEVEQAKGESFQRAWDNIVGPFFDGKEADLIQAFRNAPSADADQLVMIRMQFNALEGLRAEFEEYITTGKLAKQQLLEEGLE